MSMFRSAIRQYNIEPAPAPVIVAAPPEPVQPTATIPTTALSADVRGRYAALTKQIGWDCPEVVDDEVRQWFAEHGWGVFNGDAVRTYMDALCVKLNVKRDLSSLSVDPTWTWLWSPLRGARDAAGWGSADGRWTYALPIPERVLSRIAEVDAAFGERVAIQVTVISQRPKGDPFVSAVVKATGTRFIFDVWDEPGFTDTPSEGR